MTIPDDFEIAIWVIVSLILFKIFGYVPIVLILIYLFINGLDDIFRKKYGR